MLLLRSVFLFIFPLYSFLQYFSKRFIFHLHFNEHILSSLTCKPRVSAFPLCIFFFNTWSIHVLMKRFWDYSIVISCIRSQQYWTLTPTWSGAFLSIVIKCFCTHQNHSLELLILFWCSVWVFLNFLIFTGGEEGCGWFAGTGNCLKLVLVEFV